MTDANIVYTLKETNRLLAEQNELLKVIVRELTTPKIIFQDVPGFSIEVSNIESGEKPTEPVVE